LSSGPRANWRMGDMVKKEGERRADIFKIASVGGEEPGIREQKKGGRKEGCEKPTRTRVGIASMKSLGTKKKARGGMRPSGHVLNSVEGVKGWRGGRGRKKRRWYLIGRGFGRRQAWGVKRIPTYRDR